MTPEKTVEPGKLERQKISNESFQAPLLTPHEVPVADKGYAELGMIPRKPQKLVVLVHGGPKVRSMLIFSKIMVIDEIE